MHAELPYFREIILFLAAAGLVMPVVRRLRISPVLGFLCIGLVIGPFGLGRFAADLPALRYLVITEIEGVRQIAELGVVFLLFTIGLELSVSQLWGMRRLVFGLGAAQVGLSAVAIGTVAYLFGNSMPAAIVLGLCLALSSTAIVMQLLSEKKRLNTPSGRTTFAVLLFQDLAVVPILFLVSVFGARTDQAVLPSALAAVAEAGLIVVAIAVITMIAAHLAGLSRVIVPESGQGALGPALVPVGHAHEDYRNHPLFTTRMERFAKALFAKTIAYEFPRLWHTKGETLAAFVEAYPEETVWAQTWSCWQDSRQAFVGGKKRQCGVCAACMLRRMSVDAAGLFEEKDRYVWEDLSVGRFEDGAAPDYPRARRQGAMAEYALAGALHLQHLSELNDAGPKRRSLDRAARQIGRVLGLADDTIERKMRRMIAQHALEWAAFQEKIGEQSFASQWARNA